MKRSSPSTKKPCKFPIDIPQLESSLNLHQQWEPASRNSIIKKDQYPSIKSPFTGVSSKPWSPHVPKWFLHGSNAIFKRHATSRRRWLALTLNGVQVSEGGFRTLLPSYNFASNTVASSTNSTKLLPSQGPSTKPFATPT